MPGLIVLTRAPRRPQRTASYMTRRCFRALAPDHPRGGGRRTAGAQAGRPLPGQRHRLPAAGLRQGRGRGRSEAEFPHVAVITRPNALSGAPGRQLRPARFGPADRRRGDPAAPGRPVRDGPIPAAMRSFIGAGTGPHRRLRTGRSAAHALPELRRSTAGVVDRPPKACCMSTWTRAPDTRPARGSRRRRRPARGLLRHHARPGRPRPAGRVRHVGPPRLEPGRRLQRGAHLAITQAICEYRAAQGIDGPLFLGRDTHALSEPAWRTALEVLAANGVAGAGRRADRLHPDAGGVARDPAAQPRPDAAAGRRRHRRDARRTTRRATAASSTTRRTAAPPTPTPPAGSRTAPTSCSRRRQARRPADAARAGAVGATTGQLRLPRSATSTTCRPSLDLDAIRAAGVRIGADPLGGACVDYWGAIGERHGLDLTVVEPDASTRRGRS